MENTQYDSHVKVILSNRYILAWIIKETVVEFAELPIEQIANECIAPEITISEEAVLPDNIIGDNTEGNIPGEGKVFTISDFMLILHRKRRGKRRDLEKCVILAKGFLIVE